VGDRLAMMEMQLVIATVAQRFRFSPLGSRPAESEPVVTLRPRYGVPLAIRAR
jgi:cytochrome P450